MRKAKTQNPLSKTSLGKKVPPDVQYQAARCGFDTIEDFWQTSQFYEITGYTTLYGTKEIATCRVHANGFIESM